MRPADMKTTKVADGKPTGESGAASFLLAYIMGFLLYISVVLFGQQTMMSVTSLGPGRCFSRRW